MSIRHFAILALAGAIIGTVLGTTAAQANGQEVCAEGGDWSQHQEPEDFGPVDGAVEYCVKGGSDNSQGCDGYLEYGSFDEVEAVVNGEDACGLSHWSYRIESQDPTEEEPTDEPEGNPTPTPTEEEPGPSPTPTDEEGQPTPTPTDEGCRGECDPTEVPTPTPTEPPPLETPELPKAGFVSKYELTDLGAPWLVFVNEHNTEVWAGHNGEPLWPATSWWKLWTGVETYLDFVFQPGWYRVVSYAPDTQPTDVSAMYETEGLDILLLTCRTYDPVSNTWSERLLVGLVRIDA